MLWTSPTGGQTKGVEKRATLLNRDSDLPPLPHEEPLRGGSGSASARERQTPPQRRDAPITHGRQRSLDLPLNGSELRPALLPFRPASSAARPLIASHVDRDAAAMAASTSITQGSEWMQQLNSYASWVTAQLRRHWPDRAEVKELRRELRDGTVLIELLQALTGGSSSSEGAGSAPTITPAHAAPTTAHEMRENVERVLQFMRAQRIKMQPATADEIVEGNTRSMMRLILALAAHFKPGSARQRQAMTLTAPQLTQQQQQQHLSTARSRPSSMSIAHEMVAALARIRQGMANSGRPVAATAAASPLDSGSGRGHAAHLVMPPRPAPRASVPVAKRSSMSPAFVDGGGDDMSVQSGSEGRSAVGSSGRRGTGGGSGGSSSSALSSHSSSQEDSLSEGSDEPMSAAAAAAVGTLVGVPCWQVLRSTLAPDSGAAAADEAGAARRALLQLQQLLLYDGDDDRNGEHASEHSNGDVVLPWHTTAASFAMGNVGSGAPPCDALQVTLLGGRLQQAMAMCDDLREQLSLSKQECMQLRGAHAGLLRRVAELEEEAARLRRPELLRLLGTTAGGSDGSCSRCLEAAVSQPDVAKQLAEAKERLSNRDSLIELLRSEVQRHATAAKQAAGGGSFTITSAATAWHQHGCDSPSDSDGSDFDDDEPGGDSEDTGGDHSSAVTCPPTLPLPPPPQKPALLLEAGEPLASEMRAIRRTLQLLRKDCDKDGREQQMLDTLEQGIASALRCATGSALSLAPASGDSGGEGSGSSGEGRLVREKKRSVTFLLDGSTAAGSSCSSDEGDDRDQHEQRQ